MNEYFGFLFLSYLIGGITLGGIWFAYKRSQDSFHPACYISLALLFLYCYIPLDIFYSDRSGLRVYLDPQQMAYVQMLNLLGVISFYVGVFAGDNKVNFLRYRGKQWILSGKVKKRINQIAIFWGILGVLAFGYQVINVGGFTAAYSEAYGGGFAGSGYIRELDLLTLPAILWLMATHVQTRLSKMEWAWIALFSSPLLIHGLLGARRGPTAMILVSLVIGWYFMRGKRPNLQKLILGGAFLGLFLLFLVTNRGEIYLGSDFEFEWNFETQATTAGPGNEFIYGSGIILTANIRDEYHWGGRYITVLFIRPIPRKLWPIQYEDAAKFFGTPNLTTNSGTGVQFLPSTLGWSGPAGAAVGIVADLWIEFWWFYLLAIMSIGWVYGWAWRKAVVIGSAWIPFYALMASVSAYLVMQSPREMAFRLLFTSAAVFLSWRYGIRGLPRLKQFVGQLSSSNQVRRRSRE